MSSLFILPILHFGAVVTTYEGGLLKTQKVSIKWDFRGLIKKIGGTPKDSRGLLKTQKVSIKWGQLEIYLPPLKVSNVGIFIG